MSVTKLQVKQISSKTDRVTESSSYADLLKTDEV